VADLPAAYGAPASTLTFTLDVIIRASSYIAASRPPGAAASFQLPVPNLYTTLDAMLASLADPSVVNALAGLAGIDPVIVPPPANLDFITGRVVGDLLYPGGLTPIPDAGPSHGANLLANPTLDLTAEGDRREQIDDWLQQIALDAGLSGMEKLLDAYHQEES
jgi:hypothetical protein